MALETEGEVHVLADRRPIEAADRDHGVTPEEAEGARENQQAVRGRAGHAEQLEGAHVLTIWNRANQLPGSADVGDPAVLDEAAVGHGDGGADADRARILEERQHGPASGVGLKHGVGVHDQHQLGPMPR